MLGITGVALVLSMATWFSATAILPDLQRVFELSAAGTSWLTNAVQLGFVVAALALSITGLVDAWPPRGLMAGAAALAAFANLAMLVVPDAGALMLARGVTGVALAGVYPPALKLIASWFQRGRGLAMGIAVGALTLGSASPYLVRAIGAAFDWHLVVIASSLAAAAAAFLLLAFARVGPYGGARSKPDLRRLVAVLRDRELNLANLGYYGHMWELYAMWGWFLVFSGTTGATPHPLPLSPALLTFLVIAVGAAGCVAGGLLADAIGRTATTAAAMLTSGTCALAIGFVSDGSTWLFVALALVWGFTVIADSAQFSAMVTEFADGETVGAALALQVGVGYALTIVSIRLVPLVAGSIGWRHAFAILAPGPFVGAIAMLMLRASPRTAALAGGRR